MHASPNGHATTTAHTHNCLRRVTQTHLGRPDDDKGRCLHDGVHKSDMATLCGKRALNEGAQLEQKQPCICASALHAGGPAFIARLPMREEDEPLGWRDGTDEARSLAQDRRLRQNSRAYNASTRRQLAETVSIAP